MPGGLLLFFGTLQAAWLDDVSPIITPAERHLYLSLPNPEARSTFQDQFWHTRRITANEYFERRAFASANFGVRSDRGRMYLSLGAPQKISRLPSTRSFWPLEIWYYDALPDIGIPRQCYFTFFQRNGVGDYIIYSPALDTIRALMNPQAGTRGMFPVNDILSELDIKNNLNLSPAEQEIADAAVAVAKGVTGSGNEEILGLVLAPEVALSRTARPSVTSRLIERPTLAIFQTWSSEGVPVIDLLIETPLKTKIGLLVSVEESETTVPSLDGRRIRYQHRLFLLPGTYTLTVNVDNQSFPYPLEVSPRRETSPILTGYSSEGKSTPFEFGPAHISPGNGPLALVQLAHPQTAKWRVRQNGATIWSAETEPIDDIAMTSLSVPPGKYTLEMRAGEDIRLREVEIGGDTMPVISYNANLSSSERARSIGRQWLARGKLVEARTWLARAQPSDAVTIDLCRVAALAGDLDTPRTSLREILSRNPDNFEALTVFGFIEAKLQDYQVAADYYRRALAIKRSPAIAAALEQVTKLTH